MQTGFSLKKQKLFFPSLVCSRISVKQKYLHGKKKVLALMECIHSREEDVYIQSTVCGPLVTEIHCK